MYDDRHKIILITFYNPFPSVFGIINMKTTQFKVFLPYLFSINKVFSVITSKYVYNYASFT